MNCPNCNSGVKVLASSFRELIFETVRVYDEEFL